jgi:hypothetical protein
MSHQHEEPPTTTPPELAGGDVDAGITEPATAPGAITDASAESVTLSPDGSAELRPSEDPWSSLAVSEDDAEGDEVHGDDAAQLESKSRPQAVSEIGDEEGDRKDGVIIVEPRATAPGSVIVAEAVAAAQAVAAAATLAPVEVDNIDEEGAEVAGEDASVAASLNESAVEAAVDEAVAHRAEEIASTPSRGGMFTIPLMCAGIAIIAACLLIPQADANRRLAYERQKLQADLEATNHQVETNDEFLNKIAADPNLAERLAQRQMKIIRKGNEVLKLGKEPDGTEMSPFQLTAVAPPPELPPYQSRGGALARLCYDPKSRLYLIGAGLMAMAAGLVLGFAPKPQ